MTECTPGKYRPLLQSLPSIICISIYILNTEFQNCAERRSVGIRFLTSNTYCPQDPAN